MSNITFRTGHIEDAAEILTVHTASILQLGRNAYNDEECASWAHGLQPNGYKAAMEKGECFIVAICKDELIAFGSYQDNEIVALFVHPDFARLGVGSKLLEMMETEIFAQNTDQITLGAAMSAVSFYEYHDYTVERHEPWNTRGGQILDSCYMYKRRLK